MKTFCPCDPIILIITIVHFTRFIFLTCTLYIYIIKWHEIHCCIEKIWFYLH